MCMYGEEKKGENGYADSCSSQGKKTRKRTNKKACKNVGNVGFFSFLFPALSLTFLFFSLVYR